VNEAAIRKKVRDYLKKKGAFVFHPHGSAMSRAGIPDLVFCYHGRFGGFELKKPERRHTVTKLQRSALDQIEAAGGHAAVVTSLEEAADELRKMEWAE